MLTRKLFILLILVPITLSVTSCGFSESRYISPKNEHISNPFFFPEGIGSLSFEGRFILPSTNVVEQNANLNINLLGVFENGQLWTLGIDQIDTRLIENPDPFDYISEGFENLGYFFVTEESIYHRFTSSGFSAKENDLLINSFYENFDETLNEFKIVMALEDTEREADEDGWFSYIEVDGDTVTYSNYYARHFYSGTRHYMRIVWRRGEGIVHYVAGMGMMRIHVEFGQKLLEGCSSNWVGGVWIE